MLRQSGINFPEGSSASLSDNGVLLVTNTPGELDKVGFLTTPLGCASEAPRGSPVTASGFANADNPPMLGTGVEGADAGTLPDFESRNTSIDLEADPFAAAARRGTATLTLPKPRRESGPLFPNRTRLGREANYYQNTKYDLKK